MLFRSALASGEQPDRAVFLVDDCPESTGRGTLGLESVVAPGDLVRWNVIPIDLQAPAFIRDLRFPGSTGDEPGVADLPENNTLHFNVIVSMDVFQRLRLKDVYDWSYLTDATFVLLKVNII